jgi:putative endopeptidase
MHGPNAFRVKGSLANMPEFARAFGCRSGDPMVRPESVRVVIWQLVCTRDAAADSFLR